MSPASHGATRHGRLPMENVQSESRAVERLIRFREVKRLTGLSGATLYRKMSAETASGAAGRGGTRLASFRGSGLDRWAYRAPGYA